MPDAIQGYKAKVKLSKGSTTITGYALTDSGDGLTFYTPAGHILDPTQPIVVKVAGAVVTTGFKVDVLFGHVIFDVVTAGAVTIDASVLVLHTVGAAKSVDVNLTRDTLDQSRLGTNQKDYVTGQSDLSLTYSRFYIHDEDIDEGAGTFAPWEDAGKTGATVVCEIRWSEDVDDYFRAFIGLFSDEISQEVSALVEAVISALGKLPSGVIRSYSQGPLAPDNS